MEIGITFNNKKIEKIGIKNISCQKFDASQLKAETGRKKKNQKSSNVYWHTRLEKSLLYARIIFLPKYLN